MKKMIFCIAMMLLTCMTASAATAEYDSAGNYIGAVLDENDGTWSSRTYYGTVIHTLEAKNGVVYEMMDRSYDRHASVVYSPNAKGVVNIARKIVYNGETYPVTMISSAEGSYYNCGFNENSNITEVNLPDGMEHLGPSTFYNCVNLTKVRMPETLTSISNFTFAECYNLKEITIPASVTSTTYNTFENSGIEKVTYFPNCNPDEDTYYMPGYSLFKGTGVKEVVFGPQVENIPDYMFMECKQLEKITFMGKVKKIGSFAFYGCEGLKTFPLPETIEEVGEYALSKCTGLTGSVMNDRMFVVYVGNDASYTVPSGIEKVCAAAFAENETLESVTIPESVTTLGNSLFSNCTALKEVHLPKGMDIPCYTFEYCKSLESYDFSDIKRIGGRAFYQSGLTCAWWT